MDVKSRLIERFSNLTKEEKIYLADTNLYANNFWGNNETRGLYYYLIEEDIQKAKQCFYLCGRVDEYLIKVFDSDLLGWGIQRITLAVLSDCLPLIERYGKLAHSNYSIKIKKGSIIYAAQCIINDDMEELAKQVALLEKKKEVKRHQWIEPDYQFFKGYLNKDLAQMEEALKTLVSKKVHKSRNVHMSIFMQPYMSVPAILYAKLAWLKGFEVEVDSPLVPKELLPHRPNAHYDDTYEFLKELNEDFVPPQKKYITVPFEYQKKVMPKPNGILNYENILLTVKEAAKGRINLDKDDAKKLADMVWLAYTDPKAFDTKHKEFLRDTQIEVARKEGNEVYVYEFPMLREWNLVETEKDHFMNITGMILHEEIPFDENDDWYSGSTIAALFAAQEAQKGKGLSAKLKSLFSQN